MTSTKWARPLLYVGFLATIVGAIDPLWWALLLVPYVAGWVLALIGSFRVLGESHA